MNRYRRERLKAIRMIRELVECKGMDVIEACDLVLYRTHGVYLGFIDAGRIKDEAIDHYNKGKTQ